MEEIHIYRDLDLFLRCNGSLPFRDWFDLGQPEVRKIICNHILKKNSIRLFDWSSGSSRLVN